MFKLLDGREHLWQWDLDRQIAVSDSTVTEVHFCNKTDDCSLVVEVVDGIANIPNILLQQPFDIRVYAYCDCYTKVEATFKVKARTQPSDYVYTETDVVRWDIIADNAEKAVTEALEAATSATNTANDLYEYVEGHQLQFTDDDAGNVTLQGVQTEGSDINLDDYATKEYVNNAVGNINIPTVPSNVSAFANDAGYQTAAQVNTAITTALNNIPTAEGSSY